MISSILKQALFTNVNPSRIRSWNQPVLSNDGKMSCPEKQREPLLGFEPTTDRDYKSYAAPIAPHRRSNHLRYQWPTKVAYKLVLIFHFGSDTMTDVKGLHCGTVIPHTNDRYV